MRARAIKLSDAEDEQLRRLEQQPGLHEKVRLRAKVLRLSHRGMQAKEIAAYTGRHLSSVLRDYNRWEEKGLAGLADRAIPGRRSPIGRREREFLEQRLREERSWTAEQLAEALLAELEVKVNRESMRVCLHEMGYTWQRHRYVPVKQPEAELLEQKQQELEALKRGLSKANSSSSTLMKSASISRYR